MLDNKYLGPSPQLSENEVMGSSSRMSNEFCAIAHIPGATKGPGSLLNFKLHLPTVVRNELLKG